MKIIATIDADLERTPLGTRSRLTEPLGGQAILRRTADRLRRCTRVDELIVTFPEKQGAAISAILDGAGTTLRSRPERHPPYRSLVQTARKWSLDGWRGGVGGSCAFDEYTDTELLAVLANDVKADAVVVVPPGAALIDPALVDAMVEHFVQTREEMRMTFAQTPPGLSPIIYRADLLAQLAQSRIPPGWTLAYKPDSPSADLAMRTCCFTVGQGLRHAAGRMTADTSRSLRAMQRIVADGADGSAEQTGRWLIEHERADWQRLPREVEIELTTEDPLANTIIRPRGARVPQRGPIDPALVSRLAGELAEDDDALVVLGGHGDPLLHPAFSQIVQALRELGVYGITVKTSGHALTDEAIAAIVRHQVDFVVFELDAWTAETYARLHGGADLTVAKTAMDRLTAARQQASQVAPIVVPQMTKCIENIGELDPFFDGWIREMGWATITGYSHFGGRLPDLTLLDMSPPTRSACRRLMGRCVVLADGMVTACDQDFAGDLGMGQLVDTTLAQVWSGDDYQRLRANHVSGQFEACGICARCAEWHRS